MTNGTFHCCKCNYWTSSESFLDELHCPSHTNKDSPPCDHEICDECYATVLADGVWKQKVRPEYRKWKAEQEEKKQSNSK